MTPAAIRIIHKIQNPLSPTQNKAGQVQEPFCSVVEPEETRKLMRTNEKILNLISLGYE